jgi:hypothetical protein
MYEVACETINTVGNCDVDQQSFKAYLARWMAGTAKMCPWTHDTIMAYLKPSAMAAAAQCEYVPLLLLIPTNSFKNKPSLELTAKQRRNRRSNMWRALVRQLNLGRQLWRRPTDVRPIRHLSQLNRSSS